MKSEQIEKYSLKNLKVYTFGKEKNIMQRKIKLIWDFRGPAAAKTAEHHEIHLKEYILIEKLPINITGFEIFNEMHAIAYMVVTDENMVSVRDALKPHRGEIYQQMALE